MAEPQHLAELVHRGRPGGGPKRHHETLIELVRVRRPEMEIETARFIRRIKEAVGGARMAEETGWVRLRPDAFWLGDGEAVVFECDVTSPLTLERLQRYAELWFVLDGFGWELRLFAVDRYGAEQEVALGDWWYALHRPGGSR